MWVKESVTPWESKEENALKVFIKVLIKVYIKVQHNKKQQKSKKRSLASASQAI